MRSMIGETLERLILLQIGAAAATREKIEEIVNRLIERGRIECEEGRVVVKKVLDRARERSVDARSLVDVSMHQGLRGTADVPTRDAYEDLLFCVEQLEHRVRLLEARSTAPSPEGPSEAVVSAVDKPSPLVSGVDVAPQPPQDEPETPLALRPRR
jgi:polyhydroxyalkanoate synthesis regulator phasin